jgi:uncharacterized membrane protein YesL
MSEAFGHFRAALGEFYYDLPRMVLLNLLWFATAVPSLFIIFVAYAWIPQAGPDYWGIRGIEVVILLLLSLGLSGPGTAALYAVMNRLAGGWLLEVGRFWPSFRRFFWRGWLLAAANVGLGLLLALNIWFYWTHGQSGLWILSIIFAYLLVLWFAIQGFLFALLVELDQSVRLVIRNALFIAMDNLGLTLTVTLINGIMLAVSILPGLFPLAIGTAAITANTHSKAIVSSIERYRASGRIIQDRPRSDAASQER